ncbi:MAG TPA: hypothetical protein EYP10_02780 [Armatimonadetes bacterium]|nr:hypothetical protein [Armatimonadota bacterium]
MAKCSICGHRKGRRMCPALYNYICPQCCARQRLKQLDCPSNCAFLQQARTVEIQRRERELERKGAEQARLELEIASFAVEEAIVTYASTHPELTADEIVQVLNALEDAVHREMTRAQKVTPQLPESLQPLATMIMNNVSTMRQEVDFPHNAVLVRALHRIRQSVQFHTHRTKQPRGYLEFVREFVKPHSLHAFIAELKQALEERSGRRRIVLPGE